MPSIANQDFKIYGKLSESTGVPAKYCGELYAAYCRATTVVPQASFADGYCFDAYGTALCKILSSAGYYFDAGTKQIDSLSANHENPAYYDALWAIQQAIFARSGEVAGELEFGLSLGVLRDLGYTNEPFVNEDGYLIKGTASDGKLTSLYLGEKDGSSGPIVRLETLLPLVGELPLETNEIW